MTESIHPEHNEGQEPKKASAAVTSKGYLHEILYETGPEYSWLECELREYCWGMNNARKKMEEVGLKIPNHLEKKLQDAESRFDEAKKNFNEAEKNSNGPKKNKCLEEMQEAVDSVGAALNEVLKFCIRKVRAKCRSFKWFEHLADEHIRDYRDIHSKNLHEIGRLKLDSNLIPAGKIIYSYIEKLCDFLKDFNVGKKALFGAIRRAMILMITAIASIVGAAGVIKSCIQDTSSQPPAQPESAISEAETPNP